MKANKKLVYPLAAGLSLVAAFCVCWFALEVDLFYSVCLAALVCGFCSLVARVVCHLVDKDYAPKSFAISIYGLVAVGGWGGAVFCNSWVWCNVWLTLFGCGLILFLGTRFLKDEDQNGIPDIFEKKTKKATVTYEQCLESMRFKPQGDVLSGKPDQERPLIIVDGQPVSVNEARALGWNSAADDAEAYIKTLF